MTFAFHSIHVPSREIDADGTMTLNGRDRFVLPAPIFTAETWEEAERERVRRLASAAIFADEGKFRHG